MARLRESRTTDPATDTVDLQQDKAWLRLPDSNVADDATIKTLLAVATEKCEQYTHRALITQTWTAFIDAWPRIPSDDNYWEGLRQGPETLLLNPAPGIDLNHPPLQSVASITTYDDADAATTYSTSSYFVDADSKPGRIVLRRSATPPLPTRVANGIKIVYVAGYGDDPHNVPEQLRQGIMAYTSYLYEHRGDDEKPIDIPMAVKLAWDGYVMRKLW